MKKIILIGAIAFCGWTANGQTGISNAFQKSYEFEYKKDYEAAIKSMDGVYTAENYEMNLRLGWLTYMKGDFTKSVTFYNKAIQIIPSSVEARLGVVYPLSYLENWTEVAKVYKEIISKDQGNSVVLYRLSLLLFNTKDYSGAIQYAKKLTELHPFDYDANVLTAKIYLSLGKLTDAKAHYTRALHSSPSSVEVIEALKKL